MKWTNIEIHPDYIVSTRGDVFNNKTNKALKPWPRKKSLPYPTIDVWLNGKRKSLYVHRLVALAFIPNPENKPHVNHKDGDKTNNHVSNLEWVTHKENIRHAHSNGFVNSARGEGHADSKLTDEKVIALRKEYAEGKISQRKLADKYGVNQKTIFTALKGLTWKHI